MPMNSACERGGRTAEMMVKEPFEMPVDPIPAMALPTMNIVDDWATPHSRDPSMKRKKKTK